MKLSLTFLSYKPIKERLDEIFIHLKSLIQDKITYEEIAKFFCFFHNFFALLNSANSVEQITYKIKNTKT